jgi:hypothetical protein
MRQNPDTFQQKKLLADVIDKKFLIPKKTNFFGGILTRLTKRV